MNFHPEDFQALCYAVEKERGALLMEPCKGRSLRYKLPDPKGRRSWRFYQTTHCNNSSRMEIPYNPAATVRIYDPEEPDVIIVDHAGEPKRDAKATVCAVDDCVGLWPRYRHLMSDRSYQKP
jgi:hypothetical protein